MRLDYVSTTRPFPGTKPLSDRRFRQVIMVLGVNEAGSTLDFASKRLPTCVLCPLEIMEATRRRYCTCCNIGLSRTGPLEYAALSRSETLYFSEKMRG